MIMPTVPPGHVRALVERDSEPNLIEAAQAVLSGNDPAPDINRYNAVEKNRSPGLIVEPSFGAIPLGEGSRVELARKTKTVLPAEKSGKFLVSGFVAVSNSEGVRPYIDNNPVHSDPLTGGLLAPCLPTCGTSRPVGNTAKVRQNLDFQTLQDNGLDGSDVALAIVDSGIYLPRISQLLGDMQPSTAPVYLDIPNSWKWNVVTEPGYHRLGHGTMCAYDALIAAPNATLLDIAMLLARPVAEHTSASTVAAAIRAYFHLIIRSSSFGALVVSNSWGMFHPSLEDFPPAHPFRFIDNPNHVFRLFVQWLALAGADVIFCGNNCGNGANCAGDCASGTCLGKTDRMIMGANAYEEVLTVGGCDTNDRLVGYSSHGPAIANMFQEKPDLVAYTHFLGSKSRGMHVPDTGVSAACPVAAGCVAALRTKVKPTAVGCADLFQTLRNTARKPAGAPPGWDPAFGYGIIDPVAAGRVLGVIP